jgi:hypothetical protein
LVFIAVVESVYSAVRTDSLYTADYVWSLKGYIDVNICKAQNKIGKTGFGEIT